MSNTTEVGSRPDELSMESYYIVELGNKVRDCALNYMSKCHEDCTPESGSYSAELRGFDGDKPDTFIRVHVAFHEPNKTPFMSLSRFRSDPVDPTSIDCLSEKSYTFGNKMIVTETIFGDTKTGVHIKHSNSTRPDPTVRINDHEDAIYLQRLLDGITKQAQKEKHSEGRASVMGIIANIANIANSRLT